MKSKASWLNLDKNTKNIAKIELRKNLFFLLFVPALLTVITLLFLLVLIPINYSQDEFGILQMSDSDFSKLASFLPALVGTLCMIISAIMAYVNFRFLYDRRKIDYFQALPVNRTTQLVAKLLPQFIAITVSFLLTVCCCCAYAAILRANRTKVIFSAKEFLFCMGVSLLGCIAFSLLCNLIAVSAGKTWQYLLLCVLIFFCQKGIAKIFLLPSKMVAGLGMKTASLTSMLLPTSAIGFFPNEYSIGFGTAACGMAAVMICLFFLCTYAYNRRNNECGSFRVGSKLIVAFAAGGTVLNGFAFIVRPAGFAWNILIGAVAGFVIFLLAGLIFYKKPLEKTLLLTYAATTVFMGLLLVFCGTGGFGWSNRLPTTEQIDSVTVKTDYGMETHFRSDWKTAYFDYTVYNENNKKEYTLTQQQSIKTALQVHALALQKQRQESFAQCNNTLRFEYRLKNGKVLTRPVYFNDYSLKQDNSLLYTDRLDALAEVREALVTKYDVSAYAPVIRFSQTQDNLPKYEIVNDIGMLRSIYEEYMNLSYEQALEACKPLADNLCVEVEFTSKVKNPKCEIRSAYADAYYDESEQINIIEMKLPFTCEKTRQYCLRLNGIRRLVDIEDVSASDIKAVVKSELIRYGYYYDDVFFSSDEDKDEEMQKMVQDIQESILGRVPLNMDTGISCIDYSDVVNITDSQKDQSALQIILTQIAEHQSISQNEGSLGYAVYFVLKDRSVTPYYYINSAPLFEEEIAQRAEG